jgi:hypothetical protein
VKHWYTWISNTTSISGVTLIYMNIQHYKYYWLYQYFTSYTCSVLIFMYISVSPVIFVVFDVHVYQCFTNYTCSIWYSCISMFFQLYYTWISNTTSITGETLTYMNIKHYKYNWWNIEIHEYQNTTSITGENIHVSQCFTSYTCSVWYSCMSMFHQLYL